MKILVVDDSQFHLMAAQQLLGSEHELTICESHDQAVNLLEPKKGEAYWDAVLCDLLMPAGKHTMSPTGLKYAGQEMPVGWSLALLAAQRGAKYVAVVTDTSHHDHPASAMLDGLTWGILRINRARALFANQWNVWCSYRILGTDHQCPNCKGSGKSQRKNWETGAPEEVDCYTCDATGIVQERGKHWKKILDCLLSNHKNPNDFCAEWEKIGAG